MIIDYWCRTCEAIIDADQVQHGSLSTKANGMYSPNAGYHSSHGDRHAIELYVGQQARTP